MADNLTTYMCRLSWNLGASTFWNPQGLSRPVMGLLFILHIGGCSIRNLTENTIMYTMPAYYRFTSKVDGVNYTLVARSRGVSCVHVRALKSVRVHFLAPYMRRGMCERGMFQTLNPLNPELNPICYLLALLGAHHFLHVSRIRVKLLTFRLLMSYIYICSTHSWCF